MEKIHITKDQAEGWLGHTQHNRSMKVRAIQLLTTDMNQGLWNSDVAPPILIDEDHHGVVDGQHRLRAFIASDLETFEAYVNYVPRGSIEVIDTGLSRSLADTLTIRGHKYGLVKSAWLNRAFQWSVAGKLAHYVSRSRQVEMVENAPGLEKAVAITKALANQGSGNRSAVIRLPIGTVAALYQMQENNGVGGDTVVEFTNRIQGNMGLDDVMSRFQAKVLEAKNPRAKLSISPDSLSYMVARVYMSWVNDEDLSRLYARRVSVQELPGYPEWVEQNGLLVPSNDDAG